VRVCPEIEFSFSLILGIENGLIGMRKEGRRILVIPINLIDTSDFESQTENIGNSVVVEVAISNVKYADNRSKKVKSQCA